MQEYPRPQLVRGSYENLNGLWDYAITKTDVRPDTWDGKILVPFSPEAELSGSTGHCIPEKCSGTAECWQSRQSRRGSGCFFTLDPATSGQNLLQRSVCLGAYGGYTAFSADLTAFLRPGDNELIVQARDDLETSQLSRGKQSSKRGGIWYTPQSGIWQTVWCEWVPDNHIKAIRYTPDLITNQLYQVQAKAPAGAIVRLSAAWGSGYGKHSG